MGGNIKQIFEDSIEIKRNQPLGFLVVEPESLKFQYVPSKKRRQKRINRRIHQKRKRQTGGLLSRYDFAFAGRDTVN